MRCVRGGSARTYRASGVASPGRRTSCDERIERRNALVATVAVLVPFALVVVLRTGRDWLPAQDLAITDLRVRDMLSGNVLLMGPYSRYGWNHPGPLFFWVLAPFSAFAGGAAWGTLVGHTVVQAAGVVWAARVAYRVGGIWLTLAVDAALALAYVGTGSWILNEPWNPHVVFPYFAVFLLQTYAVTQRHPIRVVGLVVSSSFLVQTHIGYAPLVAAALAWAASTLALQRKTWPDRREVVLALAVAAVLWAAPVTAWINDDPGNVREAAAFFVGGDGPPAVGLRAGAASLGSMFRPIPPWLGGHERTDIVGTLVPPSPAWLAVPALLIAATLGVARRRRSDALQRAASFAFVMLAAGVVAASRITDDLAPYLMYWRLPMATAIALLGVGSMAWHVGWLDRRNRRRAIGGLAAAAILVSAGTQTARVARDRDAGSPYATLAQRAVDAVEAASLDDPVRIRYFGTTLGGLHGGVVDELDRRDIGFVVDPDEAFQLGEHRARPPGQEDVLYVIEDSWLTSRLTTMPGADVVFESTPLDATREAEIVALQLRLERELRDAGRPDLLGALGSGYLTFTGVATLDAADVARLTELNAAVEQRGVCRCSVVRVDARTAATVDQLAP